MLKLAIVVCCVVVVLSQSDDDWARFKSNYNKHYKSDDEESYRRSVWTKNLKDSEAHNLRFQQGLESYTTGENEYTDMTNTEIKNSMNGFINRYMQEAESSSEEMSGESTPFSIDMPTTSTAKPTPPPKLPDAVDWRQHGLVTAIKNQGKCGGCWAFSATASIEGQLAKATGHLVNLSETVLINCATKKFHNNGCDGGWYGGAFDFVKKFGLGGLEQFPFIGKEGPCHYKTKDSVTKVETHKRVPQGEESLKKAVALEGPISVAINASMMSFQMYQSGVFNEPSCTTDVDHAVLVVGYGHENGLDYWLVKNSWGTSWGEDGYVKMARNMNDQCGIASAAEYPLIK